MHLFPVGERLPILLEVEMQVAQTRERVGVSRVDLQDPVVDLLGPAEVENLSIGVGNAGEHRHIAVALGEILLPDLDGPVELLEGPVTVGEPHEGVLVADMVAQAFLVVADGLVVGLTLARRVPHAHQGVVVLRLKLQYPPEVLLSLCYMIFFEELVSPLGEF